MRKGGGKVLMALGVVLALLSGGVVFFIASTSAAAGSREIPMKAVLVTRTEIAERALITDDLLDVIQLPEDGIPPGAILGTERAKLKDTFAKTRIYARTPIQLSQVTARKPVEPPDLQPKPPGAPAVGTPAPTFAVPVSALLEKGRTMVAVDYPEASKLISAGVLRPGDKVDIYVKTPGTSGDQLAMIFFNKEIKAIGSISQTDQAAPSPTLLFIDSPQDALVLKFIESMNPFLLVRSVEDGGDARLTDPVTQDYIISRFHLQRPAAPR